MKTLEKTFNGQHSRFTVYNLDPSLSLLLPPCRSQRERTWELRLNSVLLPSDVIDLQCSPLRSFRQEKVSLLPIMKKLIKVHEVGEKHNLLHCYDTSKYIVNSLFL